MCLCEQEYFGFEYRVWQCVLCKILWHAVADTKSCRRDIKYNFGFNDFQGTSRNNYGSANHKIAQISWNCSSSLLCSQRPSNEPYPQVGTSRLHF